VLSKHLLRKYLLRVLVPAGTALLLLGGTQLPAVAVTQTATQSAPRAAATRAKAAPKPVGPVRIANPDAVLPDGWQKTDDEAVTVVGDASGLHVLASDEATAYSWRTVATLGDPEVQTDLWIGQACVTGSGEYAVVVYAPEQVTNMAAEQGVLGRAAVVNLRTGAVKQLGGGFSIAYFDPGCGTGNIAVLTAGGWADDSSTAPAKTGLAVVNARAGTVPSTLQVAGQITSAVPYADGIVGAGGAGVEAISSTGKTRLLASAPAVPYELTPDASGGLGYQTVTGNQTRLWRFASGHATRVAAVAKGSVELRQIGGRVWLVGPDASKVHGLPSQWNPVNVPTTAEISTKGTMAVTFAEPATPKGRGTNPYAAEPVGIHAQLLGGRHSSESFEVPTAAARMALGSEVKAKATTTAFVRADASASTPGSPTTPVSADRTCAIPIDDPSIQAYQPDFSQVEWAADQAVQGSLTDTRPQGLYGSSLPAYTPQGSQGWFPLESIDGGGQVPAQVLLGVLTQESNLQQASMHVIQGQTSNPLTSFNWYGDWIDGGTLDTGLVSWSNSDCGYGIGQVTSGMCLTQGQNDDDECEYQAPLPSDDQLAIAVDYQANIAESTDLLIDAWNQLWADGIQPDGETALDGVSNSAGYIDNWYMAVWAYNSGLEPGSSEYGNTTGCTPGPSCTDGNGDWGLGYADNPINPAYPPDRPTFPGPSSAPAPGGATYSLNWDMSHPQYWPYQEKVLAFAYDSITLWDYSQGEDVQAYAYADGTYTPPPYDEFCTSADNCDASNVNYGSDADSDSCTLTGNYLDHCWWHVEPASWPITSPSILCDDCGEGLLTYASGASEPATEPIASQFQQTCTESPLPSDAVIVGDGGQSALGCPGADWTSSGSLTWNFAPDPDNDYSSKIDFDQIGAGFGGHFWFGYTQPSDEASASSINPESGYEDQVITGTWTPPGSVTGWTTVYAAIPSYGADADKANYQVDAGGGLPTRNVQIDQDANAGTNTWADLGDFYMGSGAKVSLSNVTFDGSEGVDIAWSAMAFVPTSAPAVNYVAMGDSYSAGEGNSPYFPDSDTSTDTCHRSMAGAYPMMVTLPGQSAPIANQTTDGFNFIACSGAETTGVSAAAVNAGPAASYYQALNPEESDYNAACYTDWGYEQNASPCNGTQDNGGPVEGLQVNNGNLDSSTTLVTISIGGNDARFGDIMFSCLTSAANKLSSSDCSNSNYYMKRNSTGATDPEPLSTFEPEVINYLEAHLVQTYLDINAKAANAQIIVVEYPQFFPSNPTSSCNSGSIAGSLAALSVNAQTMINGFGADIDSVITQAVAVAQADGVDIQYVNPTATFAGHELCSSDPWFLPLSLTTRSQSYHPNVAGQQALADLVNQCLAGTLSSCASTYLHHATTVRLAKVDSRPGVPGPAPRRRDLAGKPFRADWARCPVAQPGRRPGAGLLQRPGQGTDRGLFRSASQSDCRLRAHRDGRLRVRGPADHTTALT
jgi:lysophospholipase L1-like esterase